MYVLLPAASQRAAGFEGVSSYFWSIVSLKDMKSLSPSLSFSPADILREGGIQLSQECFFNHSSRWTRTFIVRISKAVWFLWKLFFCRVFKKGKQETSSYLINQLPIFTLTMGWWFFFFYVDFSLFCLTTAKYGPQDAHCGRNNLKGRHTCTYLNFRKREYLETMWWTITHHT